MNSKNNMAEKINFLHEYVKNKICDLLYVFYYSASDNVDPHLDNFFTYQANIHENLAYVIFEGGGLECHW